MRGRTRLAILIVFGCLILGGRLYVADRLAFADEKDELRAQVDKAEQQWNTRGITSYQISVWQINSTWHAQMNTIEVVNGQVTGQWATCITAPAETYPCKVQPFDPAEYTVPALFATTRSLIDKRPAEALKFTFDPEYGFPKSILSDEPKVYDDDQFWNVESFTAL